MRSTRTTSRQRPLARVTGLGPHSAASGAPASTVFARRRIARACAPPRAPVERRLARADLAEPRERLRVHEVRLRLAGGVAERGQLPGRGRRPPPPSSCRFCGAVSAVSCPAKQVCQARSRASVRSEAVELLDRRRRRTDVAGREQRLAPVERELGARGVVGLEALERAAEQAGGERHVVARERAAAGRGETLRGAFAEPAAARVERAELAQVLVRLLEMPADRLVVLGRAGRARLDPVGEARVQLGARALEEAAVGGVADQHVVEAQHRLAEEPAGVALDQLAAAQRLEARVEIAARPATAAPRRRCARSERPTTAARSSTVRSSGRSRSMRAASSAWIVGGISSAASSAPTVQRSPSRFERALVHEHAHQLADEQGVALAGGEHLGGDGRRQIGGADHVRGEPHRGAGVEAGRASRRRTTRPPGCHQRRAQRRAARAARRPARTAARRCPTAPGARPDRAAAARPSADRRSPARRASSPRAPRASGARRRRSLPATAGEPASSARDAADDARASAVGQCARARAHRPARGRPMPGSSRAARPRAARRSRRRPRRSARGSASRRRRAGARARRSGATCRAPASRAARRARVAGLRDRGLVHRGRCAPARRRGRRTAPSPAPAGRSSDTTRYAFTASARPLSAKLPSGSSVTRAPTSRCVASPITTSPSRALLLQARGDVDRIADDLAGVVRHHLAGVDRHAQADRADRVALLARRARGRPLASRPPRAPRGSRRPRPRAGCRTPPSRRRRAAASRVPPCASTAPRMAA